LTLLNRKKKKRPYRSNIPKIGCPFCWEWMPQPKRLTGVFSSDACGGQCNECGAVFVVDETGKSGGQALLDAQALFAKGDLDRAMTLRDGVDFELKTRDYLREAITTSGYVEGHSHLQPKAWVIRPLGDGNAPSSPSG